MPRTPQVLDVVELSGERCLVVCVNDCACKVIPIFKRQWQNPDVVFDASEAGHRISSGTPLDEPGGGCKLLGRISAKQLILPERVIVAERSAPQYDYIPRPGTQPKKGRAQKVVIDDANPIPVVISEPVNASVVTAMETAGNDLAQLLTSKTQSRAA